MIIYYDESILTYISAIREHYGLSSSFVPDMKLKELIKQKDPKRIFLLLIDGMGALQVERQLPEDSFCRKYFYKKVSTVFPPTTVAATTSILNGKAPNENAWLGWMQYIEEADDILIPFLGKGYYNGREYGSDYVYDKIPVDNIIDELNRKGIKADSLYPAFKKNGCHSFEEMADRLVDLSYSDNEFVYGYWDGYDSLMHKEGPSAWASQEYLLSVDKKLEDISSKLSEGTMLIVLADHGQIDVGKTVNLYHSPIASFLEKKPCIEARACAFYIKEGKKEEFSKTFLHEFEEDFILFSADQVKELSLFGPNKDHPRFSQLIGDFLAVGKSDVCLIYDELDGPYFKGQHAGMREEEIYIPLIIYQK